MSVDTVLAQVALRSRERRERIAAAVLGGIAARGPIDEDTTISDRVLVALQYADALIAELDR